MKQTAVEWFEAQVGHNSLMGLKEFNEIFEKAKEMEKEQILAAKQECCQFIENAAKQNGLNLNNNENSSTAGIL
jgi:hypothetical protein